MPRDIHDLLADGAPRTPSTPDLEVIESRAARRRAGRLGTLAVVVMSALILGAQLVPSTPEPPVIGELEQTVQGATVLPLPAPGGVQPDHANGRPVFVVHDETGEVRVLDAISPHDSDPTAMKVLAYCATSAWFVDPWHGSTYGRNGAWAGGPGPHGLAAHEVLEMTDDSVVVGGLRSAPARGQLRPDEPAGPDCGDTTTDVAVEDFILHTDVDQDRVPGLLYPQRPDDVCCGLLLPDEPQAPAGDEVMLPLPAPGEVAALHVDGRPVFVHVAANSSDSDLFRAVTVLDAVSPHDSWDWGPRVLAWCAPDDGGGGPVPSTSADAGVLVDLWYGSRFTVSGFAFSELSRDAERETRELGGGVLAGGWGGGPAPTGVSRFAVLDVVPGETVTVSSAPLPRRPRVSDIGGLGETCSGRVALFPDSPRADPLVREDLVVHEPEFPDRWWYPTPERLFGEQPGLPPDELERHLDAVDPDRIELDLDALPALGDTGLVVQRPLGVEFVDLDGTSLGVVRAARLRGSSRDGHGGPVMVVLDEIEYWADPPTGQVIEAAGITPLQGGAGLVDVGDSAQVPVDPPGRDGSVSALPEPLRVGNQHRHVSGPDCRAAADDQCADGAAFLDSDMGAVGTVTPGCNPTDGLGDLNLLSICWRDEQGWLEVVQVADSNPRRIEMPRYPDQPPDTRTIGSFADAVFGGPGVVAQLSLECEIPVAVGFDDAGTPMDLWGGESWSDASISHLLGTAIVDGQRVPVVQVPDDPVCGKPPTVRSGVWAIHTDGPAFVTDVAAPAALWTNVNAALEQLANDNQ